MTPPATIAARHPARTTRRRRPSARPGASRGPAAASATRGGATAAAGALRPPLAMRLGTRAMRVGDARVLDRLVRGRAWIALMAVGLMGIVFMQVSLLKLNAGISRAVTAADTFDRQNSSLREEISKLDSGERIQSVAAKLGMVTPAAGDVHYLDGRGADGARAAASITAPKPVTAERRAGGGDQRAGGDDDARRADDGRARGHRPGAAGERGERRHRAGHGRRRARERHRAGATAAPATSAPSTDGELAPANTAPANTQNTAPTATGPPAVAGGASAPQGGQG